MILRSYAVLEQHLRDNADSESVEIDRRLGEQVLLDLDTSNEILAQAIPNQTLRIEALRAAVQIVGVISHYDREIPGQLDYEKKAMDVADQFVRWLETGEC